MNALTKAIAFGVLLFGASGCATEGYCFSDCDNGGGSKKDSGSFVDGTGGNFNFGDGSTACTGPSCPGKGDSGTSPECKQTNAGVEICDGLDNDCNGTVDEGIDFTDPANCGNCATDCGKLLPQAESVGCVPPDTGLGTTAGTCTLSKCVPNFYDANGKASDGCEYYCQWNPTGEANKKDLGGEFGCGRDDDCDGKIDEDVDLCHDTENCGVCGFKCSLANANSAECVTDSKDGTCDRNNTRCVVKDCAPGFVDQNGSPDDGCEYFCTPTNGGVEICDGLDNDCDRLFDNADPSMNDPLVGVTCQGGDKGICADATNHQGFVKCISGSRTCCDKTSNNVLTDNPSRYPDTGLLNNMCAGTDPPFVITPGEKAEACNALDDDCDGVVDGVVTSDSGGVCGSGTGTCHTGHFACVTVFDQTTGNALSAALDCPDDTPPDPLGELCDGLDNDCDGVIDGTKPAAKLPCGSDADCTAPYVACVPLSSDPTDKGCVELPKDIVDPLSGGALACDVPPAPPAGVPQPCLAGRRACFGGTPVCLGSVTQQQPTDNCNEDTNCDGQLTNQTGLVNADVRNCGKCGNDCTAKEPNANWQCLAGVCTQKGCAAGFIECGGASKTDCETACTFDQTDELCDGRDNDCDCQIDEGNITPPSVVQACGVAAGAINDPGCNSSVSLACTAGNWKCNFTTPGYCTTGNCKTTPDICDGKDNNCDGVVDEDFVPPKLIVGFKGQGCSSDDGKTLKDGVCQTQGTFVCKTDGTATTCSAAKDLTKVSSDICNGLDDDCNGLVDDTSPAKDPRLGAACFGGTQGICALPANAGVVSCILGAPVCGGPKIVNPGQVLETCNGLDDDCDGFKDNNLTDVGGLCGTSVGECTTGANLCANAGTPTAAVQCGVHVTAVPEICDGKDNDCNSKIDDNPTDVGTACNVPKKPPSGATSPCKAGILACLGSTPVCQGSVIAAPGTQDACGEDTNCDGVLTNQTGLSNNDVLNCGACGNNCNTKDATGNSVWSCQAGACVHTGCKNGFVDCNGDGTCEYACTPTSSTESCDGKDNDCNCKIDDSVPAATSVQVCGVSPSATDAGCGVTPACTAGAWKCTFPAGYCAGGNCATTSEICDGKDNNCNGAVDETFKAPFLTSAFLGQTCTTPATDGPCRGTGSYVCASNGLGTSCTAVKDTSKSKPETCNGIDDNCNGVTDDNPSGVGTQCFGGTQGECAAVAHAGATACVSGAISCTGANLLKPGQLAETCNSKDDDCDGTPDDNPTDVGGACGSGVGACIPGKLACVSGAKVCQNAVTGTPETCNGIDDDCNNVADDNPSGVGQDCNVPPAPPTPTAQCPAITSACKKGTVACSAGVPLCQNSVTMPASTPDACCTDSNCDGLLTNQPDFQNDIANCGGCGKDCNALNAGKHGVYACQAGVCVRTSCANGFINCDGVSTDCERACPFSGAELCNGVDDDCNCQVDDNIVSVPTPNQVCGVSATASDPKCGAGDGTTTGVKVTCTAGAWSCKFPTGYCDKGTPASCTTTPDLCDVKDNNCNGATDENYKQPVLTTGYLNQPCKSDDGKAAPGDGQCQGLGSYQCTSTTTTGCNAVKNLAAASQETCDSADNDCDGLVDETFSNKGTGTFVKPAVVKLGASLWMYQYEASRPTATLNSSGNGNGYWCTGTTGTGSCAAGIPQPPASTTFDKTPSCSVKDKIPWFNVTPVEAEQTCKAMGGAVCSTANYTTACQAGSSCKWGYGTNCSNVAVYPPPTTNTPYCNLGPYDFDRDWLPDNKNGLLPTGGAGMLNACYALWGGDPATSVYDITGNLREITKRATNDYPLMGGAFNSDSEAGAQCDFTFSSVTTSYKFSDTGFRCCFSADPGL